MKSGYLCTSSSPYYGGSCNLRSAPALRGAYKTKDFLSGQLSDRESLSGRSKRSRIRKGSNGSVKVAKTMSKKLDFTNLAYREAVGRLKILLEESYAPVAKPINTQYRKHYTEDSGEDTDNQSQATDRPPLSEISKYLSPSYKTPPTKKTVNKATISPHRSSRYSSNTEYAPPPPARLTNEVGKTPPEIISFIEKQEDYIEQLEKESKFCRDELSNLLGKVRDVISENEALTEHARSDLIGHAAKMSGSSESEDNHYTKLIRGRKDTPTKKPLSGPSIVFESRISELEAELAQANIDLNKLRNENSMLKSKTSSGTSADSPSIESYRKRVEALERDKVSLQETITRLQLTIEDLRVEGNQAVTKTQRTRDLADMAIFEKSQAETEIRRLKDELERQHERVRELQHEMTRRIAEERSNAERRYTYQVDQLGGDLSSQWEHASKLQLELERQKRFENDLKRDLAQKSAQIDELKQELKDKKSNFLADLAQVNAEKQSLEQEITSLRLQLDRSDRQAKIEVGRLNAEITSLRQRLDRADADILQARRENIRLNEEVANLEKELALGELKGEIRPTTKDINKTIVDMEKKHAETVSELEEMIQTQRQLMDKLTTECRTLTSKLEETSLKHKMEISALQSNVEFLTNRMISNDRLSKTENYSNVPPTAAPVNYSSPPMSINRDNQPEQSESFVGDHSPTAKSSPHYDYTPTYDSPKSRPAPTPAENYRTAYSYGDEDNDKDRETDHREPEFTETIRKDGPKQYDNEPYSSLTTTQQPQYVVQQDPNEQYTEQQYQQPSYQPYESQQYDESNYNRSYEQSYDDPQYQGLQQQYEDYRTSDYNQPYQPETNLYSNEGQQPPSFSAPSIQPAATTPKRVSPPRTNIEQNLSGVQSYKAPPISTSTVLPASIASPPVASTGPGAGSISGSGSGNSSIESNSQPRKSGGALGSTTPRNGDRGSHLLSKQSAEATKRMPTSSSRD